MGRRRIHSNGADRQKAYADRVKESGGKPHHGDHRSLFEKACAGQLVVYDGEGIDDGDTHRYTFLMALGPQGQTHTLYHNGERLRSADILSFLLSVRKRYPNVLHAGFALGYDTIHWLYDLPRANLAEVIADGQAGAWWDGYYMRYVPRHVFHLKSGDTGSTIWDVFGFFQSSLLTALSAWQIGGADLLSTIERGKAARGSFVGYDIHELEKYTTAELLCTQLLITRLCQAIQSIGLTLNRYDGAGAIAAQMYKASSLDRAWFEQRRPAMGTTSDDWRLNDALSRAYFGGRIEATQIGTYHDTVYNYDIVSAYPAIIADLPDLARGHWNSSKALPEEMIRREELETAPAFALCLVRWDFPEATDELFYPFPYRLGTSIYYPPQGYAWIWRPLIDVALAGGHLWGEYGQHWHIEEMLSWHGDYETRPFDWVESYFNKRRQLSIDKPNGWQGERLVIKLGLNSLYGKLCQRATEADTNGRPKVPPYYNLAYAGFVTASTQARLLALATNDPRAVIAFATDGLYTTEPLDWDKLFDGSLGSWEAQRYQGIVIAYSGLYYLRTADDWIERSRGIVRASDQAERCDRIVQLQIGWKAQDDSTTFPARRFIGVRLSASSDSEYEKRGRFLEYEREIDLRGGNSKRQLRYQAAATAHRNLVRTVAEGGLYGFDQTLSDSASGHDYSEAYAALLDEAYDEIGDI